MEDHHQDHDHTFFTEESRNMIIKGKRSKRPRSSSPLALTMVSTSSTTTTSDEDAHHSENPNGFFTNSIQFTRILQEQNDEQDTANCLILLAQGQASPPPPENKAVVEVAGTPGGSYVYECKTCNRGFSSFQALGGHRASHKKPPKSSVEDKPNMVKQDHSSTTLSLQLGSNQQMQSCNPCGSSKGAKIHECSICGAEFGSGQALGGHMRRHRSMPMAPTTCSDSGPCQESKKSKTLLSLDLNLPAPIEDDIRGETKLQFQLKNQMIVFSNSSLVPCHFR